MCANVAEWSDSLTSFSPASAFLVAAFAFAGALAAAFAFAGAF